jgi:hypothetical protein
MAENDNTDRPKSTGSQGTPEKSFTTNNVRSSNENFNNSKQQIRKSNDSKPTQTPTKKGK